MRYTINKHRSDASSVVGDLIYLKLQPYRQVFVVVRTSPKLAAKYFGLTILMLKLEGC